MTKYDTSNMAPGMVYELSQLQKDQFSQQYANTYNDDTFMVISAVTANSRMDTVIVAPVNDLDDKNEFGVQFLIRRGGTTVTKTVCIDRLFKVQKKRLCRFRYVVSDEIVANVKEAIQKMFFGELLYTKEQALAAAFREEIAVRASVLAKGNIVSEPNIPLDSAEYSSVDFIEPEDFKPKSQIEEQQEFARKMLTSQDPVVIGEELTEPVHEKKKSSIIIISGNKDITQDKKKASKDESIEVSKLAKVKRSPKGTYAGIKENWEEFLLDYTLLPTDQLMDKYNIPTISVLYSLGKECKELAKENGMDTKDFRRKPVPAK